MIYLFEDRKGRMEHYFKVHLDSVPIRVGIIDCQKNELTEYLAHNFSDSTAILFHSSYLISDNNITNEDVKKYFRDKKIPFVYFSGGSNNNLVIENSITNGNVNSGDMYNNLNLFLDDFMSNKKLNIPLLVYGRKYLLNSLLELQTLISLYLFDKTNLQKLSLEDFNEIIDLVDARLKEDELKEDKAKLINWLNIEKEKQSLVKQTLLVQIQKMNDKY